MKTRLYHIPFWIGYNYLWWVVALGNPIKAASHIFYLPYTVEFFFYVVFQASAVCFNLYFLIPRFLEKSRFAVYIISLLVTAARLLCRSIDRSRLCYEALPSRGRPLPGCMEPGTYCLVHFLAIHLPSTLASMTLAMSIKLTKNWIRTKRRQQLLEKEKLETELNFLKHQFNPAFSF